MTDFFNDAPADTIKVERLISYDEFTEIESKTAKLNLCGYGYAVERFLGVAFDQVDLTESDLKTVRYLYDQAEREAALRGEKWEVMP